MSGEDDKLDVSDPDGRARVLARRCDTCVAYPDDRMHLGENRRAAFLTDTAARDRFVVCHQSLPALAPDGYAPAICRGFWQQHRHDTMPTRMMLAYGFYVEVDPPTVTKR